MGQAEPSRQLRQRLPAVPTAVRETRALAVEFARERCNAGERLLGDIALCVSEAAGNAVAHAYTQPGGEISLFMVHAENTLTVEICDEGSGTATPSSQPGLGLGMKIVKALSDATFEPATGTSGLRVTMRFPCAPVPLAHDR